VGSGVARIEAVMHETHETRATRETGIFGGGRFGMIGMTAVVAGWAGKGRSEDEIEIAVLEGVEGTGKVEGCTVNRTTTRFNTYHVFLC
jgi:hypothetical protein